MDSELKSRSGRNSRFFRFIRRLGTVLLLGAALYAGFAGWFAHHTRAWIEEKERTWPRWICRAALFAGDPLAEAADAAGLAGFDIVCRTDRPVPSGRIFFAGAPQRKRFPAPDDIEIVFRENFAIGWSPSLRHPVWCAYHVPREALYEVGKRPGFRKDRRVANSPVSSMYARTGYDRGHMVPNYAAATRFGRETQCDTFLMSNISPQSPALNRGIWREIEHRIADLWSARWGELWIVVGAISGGGEALSGSNVDVPESYYQIVVAQNGDEIRVLAVLVEQQVPWRVWPRRYIVPVRELEELSGLDFFPELDCSLQDSLEKDAPTRLWPVRFVDLIRLFSIHFL